MKMFKKKKVLNVLICRDNAHKVFKDKLLFAISQIP